MFKSREHRTIWDSLGSSRRRRTVFGLLCGHYANVNGDDCQQNGNETSVRNLSQTESSRRRNNLIFVRADIPDDCQTAREVAASGNETDDFEIIELNGSAQNVESIVGTLAEAKSRGIHAVSFIADNQIQRMQFGDGYTELDRLMAFVNEYFNQTVEVTA